MSHILLTGGSGFLGRQIQLHLLRAGHRVAAPRSKDFDLETGGKVANYFDSRSSEGSPIEAIVHSAAYYGGLGICLRDPAGLITRNSRMTATLFEQAARAGVKKIVSVGSACAYPGNLSGVMRESDLFSGRCHDSVEAYGENKRQHIVYGRAYHKQHGIAFNQVALTNLYGEHDVFREERSHVCAAAIKKIADASLGITGTPVFWGSGTPRREFVHVDDAAFVCADALNWATDFEPVNVSGDEISIRELVELIARIAEYRGPIEWDATRSDGVMRKRLDGAKLQAVLTVPYRPRSLADGLRQTIGWYLANKDAADARS